MGARETKGITRRLVEKMTGYSVSIKERRALTGLSSDDPEERPTNTPYKHRPGQSCK